MDLSKFSTEDLEALQAGDLARVSTEGLERMQSASTMESIGAVQSPKSGAFAMPSVSKPNVGILEALATGAGKKVNDLGAGIKQLMGFAKGDSNAELDAEQKFVDAAYNPVRQARPVASRIGEMVPEAATATALTGGTGLIPSVVSGAAGAAIPSFLEHTKDTPTLAESLFERTRRGAISGAAGGIGGGLGHGLTRLIQPTPASILARSGVSDDAMAAAGRVGYRPTLGERTQNPLFQNMDSYFERTPGVAGQFRALREANATALNRTAAGALGQNADNVGEGVIRAAQQGFETKFPDLNRFASPDAGSPGMMQALTGIDSANRATGAFRSSAIDDLVDKGLDLASQGKLTGEAYQAIRSKLGADAVSTTDASLKGALKSIQGALDDAARASMPADKAKALDEVRKQYAAYKVLISGNVIQDGNVNIRALASALPQKGNRAAVKSGELDSGLMDLSRIAQAFKPPANPNSGSLALTEGFAGSPLRGALYGAVNYPLGKAYMSPAMQRYLSSNVLPEAVEQTLIRSGAPLGLGGLGYIESNR